MKRRVLEFVVVVALIASGMMGLSRVGEAQVTQNPLLGTWCYEDNGQGATVSFLSDGRVRLSKGEVTKTGTFTLGENEGPVFDIDLRFENKTFNTIYQTIYKIDENDQLLMADARDSEPRPTEFGEVPRLLWRSSARH